MHFSHIGIATEDISKTLKRLEKYFQFKDIGKIIYDANQDAYVCMLTLDDDTLIELISGNAVANIVKRHQYLYHTCYAVKDLEETISSLRSDGAVIVIEPKEAILFDNRRVAFLMWDLGLIELVEE